MGETALYEADALIPIDEYWDDYPNIKEYLSDEQWEKFRQPDGHNILDSTVWSITWGRCGDAA